MNKTAAIRSQARRATLTKAAAELAGVDPGALCKQAAPALSEELIQRLDPHYLARGAAAYLKAVDPANVGAAAGIAGGAGLLGDAVLPGKGKSKTRRIASGVAGAGLLGGGAYLASNENARNAVRKAVLGTLGRAVEPFRTKMAEDRSMARRAFMKAAADHSFGNLASEVVGHTGGNAAILGTLGLAAGPVGSLAGVMAGGLGVPLGGLLALIKRRRTAAEQVAYDSSSHILKNLLVPGAGSYNMWKRIGRIVGSHMEKKSADTAYIEGFCKAAETLGVDPVVLYKQAGIGGLLRMAGGALSRGGKGALGLARSGVGRAGQAIADHGGRRVLDMARGGLASAKQGIQRYGDLLRGGNVANYESHVGAIDRLLGKARAFGDSRLYDRALHHQIGALGRLSKERSAVDFARNMTAYGGGVAAGAGGVALSNKLNRQQQAESPDF